MDPSKVDGLARVLHGLSQRRQIIVFTHDDRLLQALNRLALPTTAYCIDRGERSTVTIRHVADPVDQYLRDADALTKDDQLPADLVAVAVSGYCRDALDEAAVALARRQLLASGRSVSDAERTIERLSRTRQRLALALLGDASKNGRPLDKALRDFGDSTCAVVSACVDGVHEPDMTQIRDLVRNTATFVSALREAR